MADPGTLIIANNSPWWITYTVPQGDDWWNCCDAPKPGFSVRVGPHSRSPGFTFVRTDGHGCNGRQGQFSMNPSLPTIDAANQQFWFDSHGGLAFQGNNPNYVSQLAQIAGGAYVWTVTPPGG
jgi:hypothetical protein